MAVEARHLNLFPSHQPVANREVLLNPIDSTANAYCDQIALGGVLPISATTAAAATSSPHESFLPLYNSSVGDGNALQQAKTRTQIPFKDDSVLTYSHLFLPGVRKRSRDSAMTGVINDSPLPSVPTSAVAGGRKDGNQCMTMASSFPFFGEDLSLQIMQQQLELDRLIYVHMEKVRLDMEERGRTQSQRIVATILEAITKRLRNMEDEVEKVGKLNWMLEERVKSLCIENQIWRNLAQTNEATANALRTNLEQLLAHARDDPARVLDESAAAIDDAHSCCGSSGHGGGDEEAEEERERWRKVARTAGVGVERIWEENDDDHHGKGGGSKGWNCHGKSNSNSNSNNNKRSCRKCGMAESSVLLLPCRHLCLCAGCGPTINACPICNSVKSASVHVNLS